MNNDKKIYSELMRGTDRSMEGVLSGFAGYIGIDKTFLRVAYFLFALFSGFWSSHETY